MTTETTSEALLPCPFCGSSGKLIHPMGNWVGQGNGVDGGSYAPSGSRIVCSADDCSCCGMPFYGLRQDENSQEWWNRRTNALVPAAEVDAAYERGLEDAAKACWDWQPDQLLPEEMFSAALDASWNCATAIRALKGKP